MNFVIRHLELILAFMGVIVMFLVPALLFPDTENIWKFIAIAAVIITMVHGLILWLVRRRQRNIRREVVKDVKVMLGDRINNNLTKISMGVNPMNKTGDENPGTYQEIVHDSVNVISELLDNLSETELDLWKEKYENNRYSDKIYQLPDLLKSD